MATEYKFKRGDMVRLVGRDDAMTVLHVEETEAGISYITCFSREDGGEVTFHSDQLSIVDPYEFMGQTLNGGSLK